MDITLTTPALLFPAISLLMVAFTNRFNTIGARIRKLHSEYKENPDDVLIDQTDSLKKRVNRAVTSLPPRYVYHFSGTNKFE